MLILLILWDKSITSGPLDVTYLEGLFGSTGFGTCVSGSEITVPDPGPDQRWKTFSVKIPREHYIDPKVNKRIT